MDQIKIQSTICPNQNCGKDLKFRLPTTPGVYKMKCTYCGSSIRVEIKEAASEPSTGDNMKSVAKSSKTQLVNSSNMSKMVLVQKRRFRADCLFKLNIGDTVIGRKSIESPSDIQFDDDFMSSRSVKITTIYGDNGFIYKLTVLNATNPVGYNERSLCVGETIFIQANDIITLGKTRFIFLKA